MNRHRSGWSAMGQELRKDLKRMLNRFGKDELVKELRGVIKDGDNEK